MRGALSCFRLREFFCVPLQGVAYETPHNDQVQGAKAFSGAVELFPEGHVELPVKIVLDAPMRTNDGSDGLWLSQPQTMSHSAAL